MPPKKNIDKTINGLLYLYKTVRSYFLKFLKDKVKTKTIKVTVPASSVKKNTTTTTNKKEAKSLLWFVSKKCLLIQESGSYQMTKSPQINYGNGWYGASYSATLNAMNSLKIWNSKTQNIKCSILVNIKAYQFQHLIRYYAVKVLYPGKVKAVAYACKYNLNEIYLIAHAFLESGYGTSYFSSGRAGVYNYFGIGAYDWNP